jgi:predicted TIM-barrel fold metal-dependent hydrolase
MPAKAAAAPTVDCDLHPRVGRIDDLYSYMSVGWREFYRTSPFYSISDREAPPNGQPAVDPVQFARSFLDDPLVNAGMLVSIQAGTVNGLMDHARAAAFVRSVNDYLIERWLPTDQRFRLAATVSPLDPRQAAKEIQRMARVNGVVAIFLPLINRLLGCGHYDPVFAAAQRAGLPILLHPTPADGVTSGAPAFAGGVPTGPDMRAALLPQIATTALASLVYDGVFERFPELKIVFSDFGFEWLPAALWRLDSKWSASQGRLIHARRLPSDEVRDHVSLSGAAAIGDGQWEQLWSLLRGVGMEGSILFGSDAPYGNRDGLRRTMSANAVRAFSPRLSDVLASLG